MWPALQNLLGYSVPVVSKAIETLCPYAKPLIELIQQIGEQYEKNKEKAERVQIRQALEISWERMGIIDELMQLLSDRCGDLLTRMEVLESKGQDSTEELIRVAIESPGLQAAFDAIGNRVVRLERRVDQLEGDVRRLNERYASLEALAAEWRGKNISDTEFRDYRAFLKAKLYHAEGQYAKSAETLQQLANQLPNSPAVAVALAVAHHDNPSEFDSQIKRAVRLKPNDTDLNVLASAATVAVTARVTPAKPKSSPSISPIIGIENRDPRAGDTLDGWLLEAKIGGGGWGLVFRANKKGQIRAIKAMRRELAENDEFVDASNDEVFKIGKMPPHRNVISVERNGVCRRFQCPYFVMPLLDGLNLEQHLDRHGVPTSETAMQWLYGLLDALEHAHNHGLIHRDVKPQNVIILKDSPPVLIDFGIAGLDGVAGYTQAIGRSSFFAPPELQSLGQADVRADLFMLAATLFYAFRSDRPISERVSYRYKAELVPEAFAMALDAALARNPDERPANVLEMRGLLKVNAAELDFRRKEREKAEAIEQERLEKARREAEIERQRKESEEVERRRQQEAARKQREHDELCRQNFARWKASDEPQQWVSQRIQKWNKSEWKRLLLQLKEDNRYWPMFEGDILAHLEEIRDISLMMNHDQNTEEITKKSLNRRHRRERNHSKVKLLSFSDLNSKSLDLNKAKDFFNRHIVLILIAVSVFGLCMLSLVKWFRSNKPPEVVDPRLVAEQYSSSVDAFDQIAIGAKPPGLDCTGEKGADAKTVRAAQLAWAKYLGEASYEKDFPLTKDGKVTVDMCLLPPGKYCRGEGNKQSIITLTQPLWVSKFEVTQKQYEAVMGNNPSHFKKNGEEAGRYPVEKVSNTDCANFTEKASAKTKSEYRLLTESEWEYAYRAGTRTKYFNGYSDYKLEEIAQYSGNNSKNPEKVGSKAANPFGLYDMAGNVWEWCSDWYAGYDPKMTSDPSGPADGSHRVVRGGSFGATAEDCRAAHRRSLTPTLRSLDHGFRLARVPTFGQK